MAKVRDAAIGDLQASEPDIRLGLTRAGVTGIQKAIRIRHQGREKTFAAEITCTVDLDPAQKGVHMSRFPELFGEAIDEVVIGEAFLVETLASSHGRARCAPRCASKRSTRSSGGRR
jgi:GTP cyclohydrolase-4